MLPNISIITPVWNGLPYLKECIESVKKQNYESWEMLISDDGSTDESRNYLDTLNDPRIKIFKQERNLGIFGNLNFLFDRATASICQILCQDDYMITDTALRTIVKYWENASPEIGFVRYNNESIVKCQLTKLQKEVIPSIVEKEDADFYFFLFGNIPGNLSNVSLRTELVTACGGFNEMLPYAGDFDFWSLANNSYKMGIENELLIYVRRHANTASNLLNKKGELISQKALITTRLYDKLIKKNRDIKFYLKLFGTLNYDSLQRDTAFRLALKGKTDYLSKLNATSKKLPFLFQLPVTWLLFLISAGGRVGRSLLAKRLLYMYKQ